MIGRIIISLTVFRILIIATIVTCNKVFDTHDAGIDRLLKKLNKPALKSIKSPDGDIIDCIHMKDHPIYDHPLLRNHTIQMKPSSYPEVWNSVSLNIDEQLVTQWWTINGRCPKNSIPIRRTRKEDILRAESIEKYGEKDMKSFPQHQPSNSTSNTYSHEYATLKVNGKFHGTKAVINVWKPYVQTPLEFSLAQIWVVADIPYTELNTIEAGWQVYPNHYGDANPRYFTYWTADAYRSTGCYNLDCPGFVHTNQNFALGAAFKQISSIDGQQVNILTTIWKDPRSGHWWLKLGTHLIVGYWPSSLFNHLQNGATQIMWGGEILNFKFGSKHTTTKMGSGHFPEDGWKKASYFNQLGIVDEGDIMKPPAQPYSLVTEKNCYNIKSGIKDLWGSYFFYGGPGRSLLCR